MNSQDTASRGLFWFTADQVFTAVEGPLFHLLGASARSDAEEPIGPSGPQAFRVSRAPDDGPLRVHFHPVDQFQVFIEGTGRFSRHSVGFGSVHYSDSMTPYGPIVGDLPQVTWLTLRATQDRGAHFMPDSRDVLGRRPTDAAMSNRNVRFELASQTAPLGGWRDLAADADGLEVRIGGGDVDAPLPGPLVGGRGAYLFVVSGCLESSAGPLHPGSFAWAPPGRHGAIAVRERGTVALMQFPSAANGFSTDLAPARASGPSQPVAS